MSGGFRGCTDPIWWSSLSSRGPCQELYVATLCLKAKYSSLFSTQHWFHAYCRYFIRPNFTLLVFVQESLAASHHLLLLWVSTGSLSLQDPAVSGLQGGILGRVSWKKHVLSAVEPVALWHVLVLARKINISCRFICRATSSPP